MANALEQRWQELRGKVQTGPVGKFFTWWVAELRQAMPARWQERLQHASRRIILVLADKSLNVGVDEGHEVTTLEVQPLSQDDALQQQQIEDLLEKHDLSEAPQFLALESATVLRKEISLPAAAESNLAQVLAFEMDRQTPFKASSVYFDWTVAGREASGQVQLQLFVVPRAEVDEAIKVVREKGVALTGVDVIEGDRTLGLNLLPAQMRYRSINRKARLNWALGAAAAVLLALVMSQSLYLRDHQVRELEEAIADVQGEARTVMRIKEQIEDSSEAAGFLALRRAEFPLAVEVLADVTRILPDDTYLDRLVIGKETVQLQGKSQNAQQLIELVNESEILDDASFRGSTRLDARTGLEIFEVNANLAWPGVE